MERVRFRLVVDWTGLLHPSTTADSLVGLVRRSSGETTTSSVPGGGTVNRERGFPPPPPVEDVVVRRRRVDVVNTPVRVYTSFHSCGREREAVSSSGVPPSGGFAICCV